MNPKVSVVIPAYNAAQYIAPCVDSILEQSFTDFELIIVNDGSKDGTAAICDQYAERDRRVIVVHQKNQGVSKARNEGLAKAQGEWVTFVDSDDLLEVDFLKSAMSNPATANADLILCQWITDWDNHARTEPHQYQIPGSKSGNAASTLINDKEEIRNFWSEHAHLDICRCPWGKFFRRNILTESAIRFDEQLRYGEDTLFNLLYFTKIHSLLPVCADHSNYIFNIVSNVSAVRKYRCTAESIVAGRDQIMQIFYDNKLANLRFERLMFFCFTMLEHKFIGRPDNEVRHQYYSHPVQLRLEQRCLNSVKVYDKLMYLIFKHLPHRLIYPLSVVYLRYR